MANRDPFRVKLFEQGDLIFNLDGKLIGVYIKYYKSGVISDLIKYFSFKHNITVSFLGDQITFARMYYKENPIRHYL